MIFSTFDMQYMNKKLREKKNQFGQDKCLLICKTKLFLWKKVLIPFFFYTIMAGWAIWLITYWFPSSSIQTYGIIFVVLLWLLPILTNNWVLKVYLDYKLDFIIVTPDSIFRYDQSGILRRNSKAIDRDHIKTTSIKKEWLLYSIFDNWDLIIMTDMWGIEYWKWGSKWSLWEVVFTYVWKPEEIRKKIRHIIWHEVVG